MKDMLQSPTRRQLLSMIGKTAGATAMYQAMTTLVVLLPPMSCEKRATMSKCLSFKIVVAVVVGH